MKTKTISIDIAIEVLAYLLAKKTIYEKTLLDGAEKDSVNHEIDMLQQERNIIYGRGTEEDFGTVMQKIITVYAPIVKNAVINNAGIGNLLAA
ncbi:hypothetical protein FACS189456_2920 [Bacteroidia bacterium]|nr:hypothetical protein FACS189456_2920 [Bacteroidia bacterium]